MSAENKFFRKFAPFACEGNSIVAEVDGFTITARIVRDETGDTPEQHDDGFWPSQKPGSAGWVAPERFEAEMAKSKRVMEAWKNDEWFYCGVVLSVSKTVELPGRVPSEVVIAENAASLWGIECNYPGDNNAYLTEIANKLIDEALDVARQTMTAMALECDHD